VLISFLCVKTQLKVSDVVKVQVHSLGFTAEGEHEKF